MPKSLLKGRVVLVQADTEFGTAEFLNAVRNRSWHPVIGLRSSRTLQDDRCLKDLYRHANRDHRTYCRQRGISVEWSTPDNPQSGSRLMSISISSLGSRLFQQALTGL